MGLVGLLLALIVLAAALIIMYNILAGKTPQESLEIFIKADWPARFSELGIISDALFKKISLAI